VRRAEEGFLPHTSPRLLRFVRPGETGTSEALRTTTPTAPEVVRRRQEAHQGRAHGSRRLVLVASPGKGTLKWSQRWLPRSGLEVAIATDWQAVIDGVTELMPRVLVLDPRACEDFGPSTFAEIRALPGASDLPIVTLCSGGKDGRLALERGSTDIARKPLDWQILSHRLSLFARMRLSGDELEQTRVLLDEALDAVEDAQRRLRFESDFDHLTELPNRSRFENLVERALTASGAETQVAVIYVDLDRFKAINELVGRPEADQILQQVAIRLRNFVQMDVSLSRQGTGVGTAALSRLNGDEFALLLTHITGSRAVLGAANNLLRALAAPFTAGDRDVFLSATLGVSASDGDTENGELLLQHAELAMSEAKRQGGGVVRVFEQSMEPLTVERSADIHRMLGSALTDDDLSLHYQPIVETGTARIVAAEALLRWRHRDFGQLSPADFLPATEGTDLMLELGEWVMRTACTQLQQWRDSGLPDIRMAVNIASCQLRRSDLAALVQGVLTDTGLSPGLLELELSEKGVLRRDPAILEQLLKIKEMGVRLSLDDFGTGESSIGYLKQFPLDVLKIDRSYVSGLAKSKGDAGIAAAMVSMAHSLGLSVVAEGVEDGEQVDLLSSWSCDELQGFLFSPAVRGEEFRQMLESGPTASGAHQDSPL